MLCRPEAIRSRMADRWRDQEPTSGRTHGEARGGSKARRNVKVRDTVHGMSTFDVIEEAAEVLPRKAKRVLSVAMIVLFLVSSATVIRLLDWYAIARSWEIVH